MWVDIGGCGGVGSCEGNIGEYGVGGAIGRDVGL